ncbi:hypothetical protein A8C56_14180 [Niabella ginsenosidivorans]|uniref:HTH luxR-type domain-containing protein n=1 Tax=Niabella ginsenosidivorans TaxID=1176587 RepID=A0A1A9I356_9BACT|nr:response regulator transcription factor [Niabella ginsenosidivorans]ANH81963.1 hypothetical protein A8C56_14180 [Niabella ginsenosidivorans]
MTASTKLLIVDAREIIRAGLYYILHHSEKTAHFNIFQAKDLFEAKVSITANAPDLILLAYQSAATTEDSLFAWLKEYNVSIPVIVLFDYPQPLFPEKMKATNIKGYILKDIGSEELIHSIEQVLEGQPFFSGQVQYVSKHLLPESILKELHITRREQEIIGFIIKKLSSKEISEKLFLSKRTVETHRQNILKKFRVKSTSALIRALLM